MKVRQSRFSTTAIAMASLLALGACGGNDNGADPSVQKSLTIKRDKYGVPHIYAEDVRGLFYGYAYAVAEDRLFQLEMAKRTFVGTVAEALGPGTNNAWINQDKATRSNYSPDSINRQYEALSTVDKDIFIGYAAGLNARIKEVMADRANLLPKQFTDFGFEPAEWTPFDVLMVFVGTMANRYSDSNLEVSNLSLLTSLKTKHGDAVGQQIFDMVRWSNDPKAPTTVPVADQVAKAGVAKPATKLAQLTKPGPAAKVAPANAHLAALRPISPAAAAAERATLFAKYGQAGPDAFPRASNLWIAGPKKTTDGSTVFVNGPQFGNFVPSYVTGIGLHGAGFDLVGSTPFAYPVILFATNGKIAWGATAGMGDTVDMYQETLNPANPYQYLYNGSYRDMGKRTDVIKVKGQASQTVDVYSTVHGLVTGFDVAKNTAYSKKRTWDGLEVQSLMAWINSMKAQNWDQFQEQAAKMAITINWYYSDTGGNIGYIFTGKFPDRPANQDFRLPALGDGSMEWKGLLPFSKNPKVFNPAQGYLTNWNNKPQPSWNNADYMFWGQADHNEELDVQFSAKAKLSMDEVWKVNQHGSFVEANARYFLPYIQQAVASLPAGNDVREAARLLEGWDRLGVDANGDGKFDSPAYALFRTWLPIFVSKTLKDAIPADQFNAFSAAPAGNPSMGTKVALNALQGAAAGVAQLYDFFNGKDKLQVVRDALAEAVAQLTSQYGNDRQQWLLPVTAKHVFSPNNFVGVPQANAGEQLSLPISMNRGTENNRIVLKSNGVEVCDVAPPGQDGFVAPNGKMGPHYRDQLQMYGNFDCKPQWLSAKDVESNKEALKTLKY